MGARGREVGAGHALVGLLANECWIEPGTRIVRHDADQVDELVAEREKGHHAKLTEAMMQWAAERARDRPSDPMLGRLLLGPPTAMWAVGEFGDDSRRLTLVEHPPMRRDR